MSPVERFLAIEAASGIVLFLAAAVALVWANSPWKDSYSALWRTPIGGRLGALNFERSLSWWINDGLMAIFFFVVGLEIRRELHQGELSTARRAALPIAAALGGMAVPALIYVAFNRGSPALAGWGIPMATDIAFAVGVLTLLGRRVSPSLRILLLALAVIDDLGAILVIALFYSKGVQFAGMSLLVVGILTVLAMQGIGLRSPWAYLLPALGVWAGAYAGGLHPTLAGVIVGMLTPVKEWFGAKDFARAANAQLQGLDSATDDHRRLLYLDRLGLAALEGVAPVVRLQHRFHAVVAFGIMPLFALANAGVTLGSAEFDGAGLRVFLGVTFGLVVGKSIGVFTMSWLAVRLRLAELPGEASWMGIGVVGLVAGIGFTMSLFIASLALPPGPTLEIAKLAILAASLTAAVVAVGAGRFALPTTSSPAGR
jgi:NhaA family Na+:H+ antiporter